MALLGSGLRSAFSSAGSKETVTVQAAGRRNPWINFQNGRNLQSPTLGIYPNTMVAVGSNAIVTPDVAPTGATSINASTDSDFKGVLTADPITGVVRITNAHPAGSYTITVKAFNGGGMTSTTYINGHQRNAL